MTSLTDDLLWSTWHTLLYTTNLFLQSSLVVSVKITMLDTKCGGRSCKELYSATSCGAGSGNTAWSTHASCGLKYANMRTNHQVWRLIDCCRN